MAPHRSPRTYLSLAAVLARLAACQEQPPLEAEAPAREAPARSEKEKPPAGAPVLFGASDAMSRNLANTTDKGIPDDIAIAREKGKVKVAAKNLKWSARLGGISYTAPVIAGGRVF